MLTTPNINFVPTVAFQGSTVGTQEQEPRSGHVQPRSAPLADTQHSSLENNTNRPKQDRGNFLDMVV